MGMAPIGAPMANAAYGAYGRPPMQTMSAPAALAGQPGLPPNLDFNALSNLLGAIQGGAGAVGRPPATGYGMQAAGGQPQVAGGYGMPQQTPSAADVNSLLSILGGVAGARPTGQPGAQQMYPSVAQGGYPTAQQGYYPTQAPQQTPSYGTQASAAQRGGYSAGASRGGSSYRGGR